MDYLIKNGMMKNVFIVLFLFVFFLFINNFYLYSQNTTVQSDLESILKYGQTDSVSNTYNYQRDLNKAKSYVRAKKYREALRMYLDMQDVYKSTFDIKLGIANVYYMLGDITNAKFLYTKIAENFSIQKHNNWFLVNYRRAQLLYNDGDYEGFVQQLQEIVDSTKDVRDPAIFSIAFSQGIDEMVKIFNIEPLYSYMAYRELGAYLIISGKSLRNGLEYSFIALSMMTHWAIGDILKKEENRFSFTDMEYFFEKMLLKKEGREFLVESGAYRILYALQYYFSLGEGNRIEEQKNVEILLKGRSINYKQYVTRLFNILGRSRIFSSQILEGYYPVLVF